MAWVSPTATEFKARFPAFASVSDAVVNVVLAEAALQVDETWVSVGDFTLGINLLTAHILTLDGHGTGAEAEAAAAGTLGFKTMKSGNLTLERFSASESGSVSGDALSQTSYGKRFIDLRRRNVPAVMVV
jgi:hypothetical protein